MRRFLALLLCLCLLPQPVRANQAKKTVALTFDDGPSGRFTRTLLDGLQARDVKATFLLCGYRIQNYPRETRRIFEEGHEIGLHGYSHHCMSRMCEAELEREIADTLVLLPDGCTPTFLRPPGGKTNAAVRNAARQANLAILTWSIDPKDWATHNAAAVEKAVLEHVRDGDVILLHDMSDSSVEAALYIVDMLQKQGFTFVTASELAALHGIVPEAGKAYARFDP